MSDANVLNIVGQPSGTMVEKVLKSGKYKVTGRLQVPIEELKVGDYVSSYNFKDATLYSRSLLDIKHTHYSGNIINIQIGNRNAKCTPYHKCTVRYNNPNIDYCVYIMRKGDAFRVGMSKISHTDNGCGPYKRLKDEGGDAIWILKTFSNRRDALLEECKISIKFRLPQAMFKFKEGRGSWSQEEFDYVWSGVSNIKDAENALIHYNRSINHPYFTPSKKHTSIKRPHNTVACNILDHSEMMIKDVGWVKITHTVEEYTGVLYSLSVDVDNNYYSDHILI